MERTKPGGRFWAAMLVFGLMGQVAWVVENMYFNVFIYKMFHAGPGDISAMVMASAVTAALTTIVNSDGTESFLPNANIFAAALIVLVPLALGLCAAHRRRGRAQ